MEGVAQQSNLAPPVKPGEIRNPRGINKRSPIRSLLECLRDVCGEDHLVRHTDGTTETISFNQFSARAIKRMVAEVFDAAQKKERLPKGLYHKEVFEFYLSRMAPLNEAGDALEGQRSLTVILSREEPHRPVEVIDVTPAEPKR